MPEAIIVDDEEHVLSAYAQSLELSGMTVNALSEAERALEVISKSWPGVLITDIRMPKLDGLSLMKKVLEVDPDLPVILMTAVGDVPMAVKAMRDGAYDFLEKPFPPELLIDSVRRAQEKRALTIENRALKAKLTGGDPLEQTLVGRSDKMRHLREQIASYGPTEADVLILGETGAGKDLVARSLHEMSARAAERFVPINCGALPENIIESELFGHEKGAFTGAVGQRIGKFEHAMGGTIFLDEIESMPMSLQVRLLRVLQDRKVERLGSNEPLDVDIRIIAATKQDLKQAADTGQFREDLYYRLNVLSLSVPALRERREDIPLLFHHFAEQAAVRLKKDLPNIDPETLSGLLAHDWPGNVRELQNAAMRYALEVNTGQNHIDQRENDQNTPGWLAEQMAHFESELIRQALADNKGSLKKTYEQLGISRKCLYDKIQKHGIERSADH